MIVNDILARYRVVFESITEIVKYDLKWSVLTQKGPEMTFYTLKYRVNLMPWSDFMWPFWSENLDVLLKTRHFPITSLNPIDIFKKIGDNMTKIETLRNNIVVESTTRVSKLSGTCITTKNSEFGVSLINSICLSFQSNKCLHFTFQNSTTITPLFNYKNKADAQVPFNVSSNATIRSEWHNNNDASMLMHFNENMDFTKHTIKLVIKKLFGSLSASTDNEHFSEDNFIDKLQVGSAKLSWKWPEKT